MRDKEQEVREATGELDPGQTAPSASPSTGSAGAQGQALEEDQIKQPDEGVEEAPTEETEPDEMEALRQELEKVKAQEAEYLDGWQRARAELSNARKRFQREREQTYANARGEAVAQVLPVVDDFERALETMPENLSGLTWTEGILLIQRNLEQLLAKSGVTVIEAVGRDFDPYLHEALTHEPSETVPEGQVIAELQKGYQMGDRVLRPSVVRVSAGLPPNPEPENEEQD